MVLNLSVFEALTEAGVKPEAARRVERQLETAIHHQADAARKELHEQMMTKADGRELRNELKADILELRNEFKADVLELKNECRSDFLALRNEVKDGQATQTWKFIGFVIAINSLLFAALKFT
jgi:hypothetical protein